MKEITEEIVEIVLMASRKGFEAKDIKHVVGLSAKKINKIIDANETATTFDHKGERPYRINPRGRRDVIGIIR